jgi:hypothetical protein
MPQYRTVFDNHHSLPLEIEITDSSAVGIVQLAKFTHK